MLDMERMSDEELRKIAGEPENLNLESLSDEQLRQIAGEYAPEMPAPATQQPMRFDEMTTKQILGPLPGELVGPSIAWEEVGKGLLGGLNWLKQAPGRLRAFKQLPTSERLKILGQLAETGAAGTLEGLLGVGAGASQKMAQLVDAIAGTKLAQDTPFVHLPEREQKLMAENPLTASLGKIAGESAGLGALGLGGVTGLGDITAKKILATQAPKALKMPAALASRMASQAAAGGIAGTILQPDKDLEKAFVENAKLAAGLYGGAAAVKHFGPKVFRTLIGANATPEEMQKNINAVRTLGIDEITPVGAIVESPHAKALSSLNAALPGSGQAKDMMQAGKAIRDKTQQSVDILKHGLAPNYQNEELLKSSIKAAKEKESARIAKAVEEKKPVEELITKDSISFINDVRKGREAEKKISKSLYDDLEEKADNAGAKVKRNEIHKAYDEYAAEIKGTDLEKDIDIKAILPQLKVTASDYVKGTYIKPDMTFGDALKLRKRINKGLRNTNFDQKDKKRILTDTKDALDQDLEQSAINSNNQSIINALAKANEHYKNNVAPLDTQDVLKFIDKGEYPSKFINAFHQQGNFGTPESLNKVAQYLSAENKGKFAAHLITKSARELGDDIKSSTAKDLTQYLKLPDGTKRTLLRDHQEVKKTLDAAVTAKDLYGMDLNQMLNPQTGNVAKKIVGWLAVAGPSAGAGTAAGMEGAGLIAGLGASAKGALLPIAAGQTLRRAMRSKKFKDWLIKQPEPYQRNFYKALPFVPGYGEKDAENER
jgi:hypothetical protein